MIVSGLKTRSINDQVGNIEFDFAVTLNSSTGFSRVGISGANTFQFSFKNGNVYDTSGRFINSYIKGIPTRISGQLGQSSYDYYVNNDLIGLGNSIPSGVYSWIFAESNESADIDMTIRGVLPDYTVDKSGSYPAPMSIIDAKVVNNDPNRKFRIFDVGIDQPSCPYYVFDFTRNDIATTGHIYLYSDQIGLGDNIVPLTLKTNFGEVSADFFVSGDHSIVPDIYLNVSPDTLDVTNQEAKNYSIQFSNYPSGGPVGIYLKYEAGITGNIYFFKEQLSPLQTSVISGEVVGCGGLTKPISGTVSGLDPKTSIWETGLGTGNIYTNRICATGNVQYDYSVPVYGSGEGEVEINYVASGWALGTYSGNVPLTGGYVDIQGHNYSGTGDFPGVAVGLVPTGFGKYFAHPTGCVPVQRPLVYNVDYFSGNIEASKVYSGPLEVPYSVLAVGRATGQLVSGSVGTNFTLNFEQGHYHFTKYFSGIVSGHTLNTGDFNPTGCLPEGVLSSGIMTGYFVYDAFLDCGILTGMPQIHISGTPSLVYDSRKRVLQPNSVVLIKPSGGFGTSETSYNHNAGLYTRTLTSRMGATPSGSGYFQNVVGECLFVGEGHSEGDLPDISDHIWKETIDYSIRTGDFDSNNNILAKVSTEMYLKGTGYIDSDMDPSSSGYSAFFDSGVMHFSITGPGKKTIALRGLNAEGPSAYDRIFEFNLYKNGIMEWGDVQGINDPGVNYEEKSPWAKWRVPAMDGVDINTDTVLVLSDLTSGYYSLYAFAAQATRPVIYFKNPVYSGCESSKNLYVTVTLSGRINKRAWVELTEYEEITAHSGVNYDPVFFSYTNTGTSNNVGLYFDPSPEDTQDLIFSIPIYDNAAFGKTHEFYMRLSNASGADLGYSQALIQIYDNDTAGLVADPIFVERPVFDSEDNYPFVDVPDGAGNTIARRLHTSGTTFTTIYPEIDMDCSVKPAIPVQIVPACWPDECVTSRLLPSCTDKCPPKPCCSCDNLIPVVTTCPGYSGLFSGSIVMPGARCDELEADGCGRTDGYIMVGQICSAKGSAFQFEGSGAATYDVKVVSSDCPFMISDDGSRRVCPPDSCADLNISGCNADMSYCSGNCSGDKCQRVDVDHCKDYTEVNSNGKRVVGEPCYKELVFLKVSFPPSHHETVPCTNFWAWSGWTTPHFKANPARSICPSPP